MRCVLHAHAPIRTHTRALCLRRRRRCSSSSSSGVFRLSVLPRPPGPRSLHAGSSRATGCGSFSRRDYNNNKIAVLQQRRRRIRLLRGAPEFPRLHRRPQRSVAYSHLFVPRTDAREPTVYTTTATAEKTRAEEFATMSALLPPSPSRSPRDI